MSGSHWFSTDSMSIFESLSEPSQEGPESETSFLIEILKSNPEILRLANNEKMCKLTDEHYLVCPDYCCGEFWESQAQFCCKNNFKPIRSLFFFLLVGFVILFATIIIYLFTEIASSIFITRKMKELEERDPTALANDIKAIVREFLSSDETSLDDESSIDNDFVRRTTSRPKKILLNRHSQSFKDMSKKNSSRRLARSKSAHPKSENHEKE